MEPFDIVIFGSIDRHAGWRNLCGYRSHSSEPKCAFAFTFSVGSSSGFSIVGLLGLICLPYVMLVVTDNFKEKPQGKHRNHPATYTSGH
jgi:hypothetical protein